MCFSVEGEKSLKMELFGNEDITLDNHVIFRPRFPQTQFQNERSLLSFQFPPV